MLCLLIGLSLRPTPPAPKRWITIKVLIHISYEVRCPLLPGYPLLLGSIFRKKLILSQSQIHQLYWLLTSSLTAFLGEITTEHVLFMLSWLLSIQLLHIVLCFVVLQMKGVPYGTIKGSNPVFKIMTWLVSILKT